jgi:RND family efflux transporter MFP subunit
MNASTLVGRFTGKRRVIAVAVAAIALGGTAAAIFGQERSAARAQETPAPVASIAVDVVAPEPAIFARAIAATGTVSPRDELVIGSDASGVRLLELLVDTGSVVRKGELLARADDSQLQAQLAQQEAQVKSAEVDLAQAQANLERSEQLKDSGVYSIEQIQTRRTSAAAAAAKLELAQAQRREFQVRIGYTRVVAPASGVISRKTATVGAVVQPGSELFRMIRDGELEWRAELPSHSLARIQPGASARVMLDDGRAVEAKVRMVAPTIDPSTRNGLVYLSLPKDAGFRAGAHAKGEILLAATEALAVPESSVLIRDGYAFVYVLGAGNIARQTRIEAGARQNGKVEVIAGLDPKARVVDTGAGFVKDGELVRVAPANSRVARLGEQS